MTGRDWILVAGSSVLTMFVISIISDESPPASKEECALERDELKSFGSAPPSKLVDEREGSTTALQKKRTEKMVQNALKREKRETRQLQSQVESLRTELSELETRTLEKERYKFDLDQNDWRELLVEGRMKYRIPCLMSLDSQPSLAESTRENLGLSPDDAEIVAQAHRRSNERVWKTVKPLCVNLIRDEAIVDLLGPMGCRTLVEKAAYKSDPIGSLESRGLVAEVHAGMRPLPEPEEQLPIFSLFMTLTSEAKIFEEELAEHFGPDEAKRIWHAMPCASSRS